MRVLVLSQANSPHTRKWVSGLSKKGVEVFLFSLIKEEDDFYDKLGVKVYSSSYTTSPRSLMEKLGYLSVVPNIRKLISELKPDIVHSHYASSYGLLGVLSKPKKLMISVWGSDVYFFPKSNFLTKWILKRVFKKADMICSTSYDMAREIEKYTSKKIEVIPFGIDFDLFPKFERSARSDNPIKFVSAKSLKPIYCIDQAILGFKDLLKSRPGLKAELHIAGDGEEQSRCEEAAGEEMGKSIFFHGRITPEEMPDFYLKKHILVNVPSTESFGVSILEASASGLAVIATNAGGIPEVVMHNKTGILIEKPEPSQISNAMKVFADDTSLIQSFGNAGRTFVEKNYDFDKCLDAQIDKYRELNEG